MGRPSTAWETGECKRVDLSYLLRNSLLRKGAQTYTNLSWTANGKPNGSASIFCSWQGDGMNFIRLEYTVTNRETGTKEDISIRVELQALPSNLGHGEVLYMICPRSGIRCRILYKAYGSDVFMSRVAYKAIYGLRIYYPTQTSSSLNRPNDRYWNLEKKLEKNSKRRKALQYNSRPTKRSQWLEKIMSKIIEADYARWEAFDTWAKRKTGGLSKHINMSNP